MQMHGKRVEGKTWRERERERERDHPHLSERKLSTVLNLSTV